MSELVNGNVNEIGNAPQFKVIFGAGPGGENGAVFTPAVDSDGVISWTNDKGLDNPESRNIKGQKGDPGDGGSIASSFSTTGVYKAGDYVWYDGALYRFKTDHAAGEWNSAEASAAKIGADVTELKSALDNAQTSIDKNIGFLISPITISGVELGSKESASYQDITQANHDYLAVLDYSANSTFINAGYYATGRVQFVDGKRKISVASDTGINISTTTGGSYSGNVYLIDITDNTELETQLSDMSCEDIVSNIGLYIGGQINRQLENIEAGVDAKISDISNQIYTYTTDEDLTLTFVDNALLNTSGDEQNVGNQSFAIYSAPVTADRMYRIKAYSYPGKTGIAAIYWYNANGNLLSFENTSRGVGYGVYDLVCPKNAVTVKINARIDQGITPYVAPLSLTYNYDKWIQGSPLYGKKVAWYGDSIISNRWWTDISTMFGMTSTNNGVGGTKISGTDAASMCQTTRIEGEYGNVVDPNTGEVTTTGVAIPEDADYIVIGAGTNDWLQSVPLGGKNVVIENGEIVEDVTTFRQACHVMFRRLATLRPNAKVVVLGTPFAKAPNRTGFPDTYGLINAQNLTAIDYGEALCEIAEQWGHQALRYGTYMDINDVNVATYLPMGSGTAYLHPTSTEGTNAFINAALNGFHRIIK